VCSAGPPYGQKEEDDLENKKKTTQEGIPNSRPSKSESPKVENDYIGNGRDNQSPEDEAEFGKIRDLDDDGTKSHQSHSEPACSSTGVFSTYQIGPASMRCRKRNVGRRSGRRD
tara:strand:- start:12 stop:353 length:342 start_codon:yes stop_codon:yes gene_type:complete